MRDYVTRMDRRTEERTRQFTLLTRLMPFPADAAIRVLDVGAGHGVVAAAVLEAFPNATAVLLDISVEMMRLGRERLSPFEGRYRYVTGDFADGVLPAVVEGSFDAVVSAHAIHHLPAAGKQTLYRDIAAKLVPDGCFLNLDQIAAPDHQLQEIYDRIGALEREEHGEQARPAAPGVHAHRSEMQPLEHHLAWLSEAGLQQVDCFYKWLGSALFGGYRPASG